MTAYFVTGATGFIGRHLVERLLEREGDIHVLVREGSRGKLEERWGHEDRVKPVIGDLGEPNLGVDPGALPKIDHFFHLAAIYDMGADEERNAQLNVGGTKNAIDLANALEVGRFQHVSSIAVAGDYDEGTFNEDMFDEGQPLTHPYHRTKFESEKLVRTRVNAPWRVYRPSLVVGDSRTGEMDKIDGPYYFFKLIQKVRRTLPQWFPLISVEWGWTNIVPVDYVAAVDRPHRPSGRPRRPGLPRRRPEGPARRRGPEHVRRRRPRAEGRDADRPARDGQPAQGRRLVRDEAAGAQADPLQRARRPRHPGRGRRLHRAQLPLRRARHAARDPRLRDRAAAAEQLRRQALGLLGAPTRPRPLQGPQLRGRRQRQDGRDHRRVVGHRPRRRAEDRRRRRGPDPRRADQGEARRGQGRDRGGGRHRVRRARATCRTTTRSRDWSRSCSPTTRGSTCWSTTRAAASAAASRCPTTASTTTSGRSGSTTCRRSS